MKKTKANKNPLSGVGNKLTVRVKTAKGRKVSSTRWLQRQLNDPYVELAKEKGYASRAAFKLLEIEEKFNLFQGVKSVIDLGSAPGSWSQVISKIPAIETIIALDLLEMHTIEGVHFMQGDFRDLEVQNKISNLLGGKKLDLILSDMAPNLTGHKLTDHLRIISLCEEVVEFVKEHLNGKGNFAIKAFHGGEFGNMVHACKQIFEKVVLFKPKASRSESSEMYMVCLNYQVVNHSNN
jgi:23S rRNA (uridine2552-2'-O)-methyltransferase